MKIERNFTYALLAGALLLTSCSSEDTMDNQVESLPEGMYPLTLATTIQSDIPATRVTEDTSGESQWSGDETVKVKVGSETKDYKMDANGNLTATQPFYWTSTTETKQVTAWYPAAISFSGNLQDQSTAVKYMACDVLKTDQTAIPYITTTKSLEFKHQMAKIIVNLFESDGSTPMTNATAVQFLCANNISFSEGNITKIDDATGYISPLRSGDNSNYKAMIIPQDMNGKQFISVTYDGNTYYWKPKTGEANLIKGNVHIYKITVMTKYLDVEVVQTTSGDISWDKQEDTAESGTVN